MQNFPNSPAPPSLPPGFSGRGAGGPTYQPQPLDPQISPRMPEDYSGMQQQQPPSNPQSHSQHPLHRAHPHPSQAGHMLGFPGRNRGAGDPTQGHLHGVGSSNPYRKEAMDYYLTMGGKDRQRRGGMGYGASFGYSNMDGHIPHQYRHAGSGPASSSGMMSPYPLDYGSTGGSGGSSSGVGGAAGAFSPSHQYNMGQNAAMQSVSGSPMQHRQHAQSYPGPQALHHGQQQRAYHHSGHRMTPQYPHYSPQGGASTGSAGMYSPPPHRYHDGANSLPSMNSNSNSVSSSAPANNVGPMENVPQGYHSSSFPGYSPQTHALHKQPTLQHHNSQHNIGAGGYDGSHKMQHHGPPSSSAYSKHQQASNSSIPHQSSQEIAKSPMHSQTQQSQINQNFSPISNPSPAASAVQSPSCSSSPSPLMTVSEGQGNHPGPTSYPHPPNPRSGHGRLLQTIPQLSPTPNSNSSVSSCGSSGSQKAAARSSAVSGRSRMAVTAGPGPRDEASAPAYPASPLSKLQDTSLNSINALTSQVANLPNTVQHMLLTDTVLSQKRGKDGGSGQMQPGPPATPSGHPRSRNVSAASSTSTVREGSGLGGGDCASEGGVDEESSVLSDRGMPGVRMEREEQLCEGEQVRMRQMSGASSGSEPTTYYAPSQGDQVKMRSSEQLNRSSRNPQSISETKTPVSSSSQSPALQSAESCSNSHRSHSVAMPSHGPPLYSNSVSEPGAADANSKHNYRKTREIKNEGFQEEGAERREKGFKREDESREQSGQRHIDGQDKENRLSSLHNVHSGEREGKHKTQDFANTNSNFDLEEQQNASGVGVIVSARSEIQPQEKPNRPQDNCTEEKPLHAVFRESSSHNGEKGVDLSVYSSHHQLNQKTNFGRLQSNPHAAANKCGYPESPYGAGLAVKNRGRPNTGGVMEANTRYQDFPPPQPNYGSLSSKEAGGNSVEAPVKRGGALGPKGHDDNSQLQQQFPSLLQEVLQGYHLDRRYGRPEQVPPATQSQNVALANFQTRHPYGISESMRTQSGMGNTPQPSHMVTSGKPFQPNQRQLGVAADFGPQGPIPFIKSEAVGTKGLHNVEKSKMAAAHGPQNTDSFSPTPPKHINLADYSLPQRKPPPPSGQPTSSSSAVQELLLQDSDPLGATDSQKSPASFPPQSSGRRSVICDVSPVRRSTPDSENDKEKESHTGSLVSQQKSFSSPPGTNVHMTGNGKDEVGQKHEVKMEVSTKEITPEAGHLHPDHHGTLTAKAEIEYHKSLHQSGVVNVDPYRKGKADMAIMASRHSQQAPRYPLSNTNPMSLPPRHQGYPHNVDLSSAHASGYSGYRYGDTRERNIMSRNPHFPSHHPYHPLSPTNQLQSSLSANKLTVYPHSRTPHHPHDPMNEWTSALTRPTKDIMMQSGSSPGRNKLGQSEHSQRMLSQVEMLANEQRLAKPQLPHQSAYYDMKMWEMTHSGRDGAVMMEGDPYHRTQPLHPAAPPCPVTSQVPHGGLNSLELDASRGALEDVKPPHPLLTSNSLKVCGEVSSVMPQQGPRPAKTGGSGDTNLLMLRRRVRSFISPIPAKRQHQDGSQVRVLPNSHHSPAALSESSHLNDEDSSSSDITCSRLSSPTPGQNIYSQSLSPSGSKKGLPPRKGRGLKLEAIVQKITPNVRKSPHSGGQVDSESNHYGGFSEISQFSDSQDQDYMDDSHSLNEMMSYRGMDETVSLPSSAYSCDPLQTGLKSGALQADFDFGLGATASSMSDKEDLRIATDFSLLGPLPPPPPLPRPVPGSPPPSCSALSDIQHFTNTYQQLETRRGDQSAANILRQKLQETAMGFDDYPSADYYGSTPPHHSQGQGHLMNRQMCSGRSSMSMTGSPQDSKGESLVPKGYFPSGKKKGRPVGSVNKQKRVQQAQTQNVNAPPIQPATSPAAAATAAPVPQTIPVTDTITPPLIVFPPADQKPPPSLTPPILTQVKIDAESEDIPLEIEVKPLRRRRRVGVVKAEGDVEGLTGRQRRRRRTAVTIPAKEDFETSVGTGSTAGIGGGFSDSRRNVFAPYVHVERKVPEIGAVCTIVNAEEEKREKGERGAASGVKTSTNGIEALLTSALTSQLSRREKEMERLREKKEAEEVDTSLQAGKVLPLSGYVLSGPVITETNHSGRLLCCLCQKWANYKNLGDLYGPYYPAEYAAKLPKNQPQVRQSPAVTGGSKTGLGLETNSNVANAHETQVHQEAPVIKPSADMDWRLNYPANPGAMVGTASPAGGEEIMMYLAGQLGTTTSTSNTKVRNWDTSPDIRPIPELWKQPEPQTETPTYSQPSKQPQVDDAQQRPQHRKLTSHPRFKRRHKSSDKSPRMVPSNSKASLPFQPPPPALDSLGPLAQLAQLPQMPMDPEELWIHEGCIVWASGVFLVNGRLYGLQEALDGAREACCSFCEMAGSTLGCYSKGCTLRYHYLCAMEADCSLNEENFSLRCPQHKFPQSSRPTKSVYLEQSERG